MNNFDNFYETEQDRQLEEIFEALRQAQFPSLRDSCYLDNAANAIPCRDLLRIHNEFLENNLMCNTHSHSIAATKTSDLIQNARSEVLKFIGASDEDYDVTFVSNATGALRLVGESFPFDDDNALFYPMNSHTSAVSIRSFSKNAAVFSSKAIQHSSDDDSTRSLRSSHFPIKLADKIVTSQKYNLLCVPGECNFNGIKCNFDKVCEIVANDANAFVEYCSAPHINATLSAIKGNVDTNSIRESKFLWCLDASKLVATSPLDVSKISKSNRPHFIAFSFYKIFGFPTGVGALVVRRDVVPLLKKNYFGGGTVAAIAADRDFLVSKVDQNKMRGDRTPMTNFHEIAEDGTLNYQGIIGVSQGIRFIDTFGGLSAISRHGYLLVRLLRQHLHNLLHDSGHPCVVIHGGCTEESDWASEKHGPLLSLSVRWSDGTSVGYSLVKHLADMNNIIVRAGCYCNIGGCQESLNISNDAIESLFLSGKTCGDNDIDLYDGQDTGAVRVSFGYCNTKADVGRFIQFLRDNFLNKKPYQLSVEVLSKCTLSECNSSSANVVKLVDSRASTSPSTESVEVEQTNKIKLKSIIIYPIKSCQGFAITDNDETSWPVCSSGLFLDRQFAVVDAITNRVLTQKNFPKLAKIKTAIDLRRRVIILWKDITETGQRDVIEFSYDVNLNANVNEIDGNQNGSDGDLSVRICNKSIDSGFCNQTEVDAWISNIVGISCKLVGSKAFRNEQNDSSSDIKSGGNFSNGSEFLVISQESIDSLQKIMSDGTEGGDQKKNKTIVTSSNFRPNIVFESSQGIAHFEDVISSLLIHATQPTSDDDCNERSTTIIRLLSESPCARCVMVNISKDGDIDSRVLQTVGKYRKVGGRVNFGQLFGWDSETRSKLVKNDNSHFLISLNSEVKFERQIE